MNALRKSQRRLSRTLCHLKPSLTRSMSTSTALPTVYIVAAVRTPIGTYNGSLSSMTATQLGTIAIKRAIERSGVPSDSVDEVFMGNVLQANLGQAPARQAALGAGLPLSVPCTTVNKVCSSGLKSLMFATQSIQLGQNDVVVAGGMESMSNTPYYSQQSRFGARMGHIEMTDGMIKDGLWDVYNDKHMGHCGDKCARDYDISREQQDDFAVQSFQRAQAANMNGAFDQEIIPVEVPNRRGPPTIVDHDEGCQKFNEDKLRGLRTAFSKEGTVTAGNASQLSDGAAAIVVVSQAALEKYNLTPLVRVVSYADAARDPEEFTVAPSLAMPKALARAGMSLEDLGENDYFEVNEAFAVVALANAKLLNLPNERLNIYGGAVALGHPLGCSGARIICSLITALKQNGGRLGVAGICNGGGGASSMILENCI